METVFFIPGLCVIVVKAAKIPIVVAILFAAYKQWIRMKNSLNGSGAPEVK